MEPLKDRVKTRQLLLANYFEQLADERNNALGSPGGYSAVIDQEHNHFMLLRVGWTDSGFVHKVLLHFDLNPQTGNIWVQQNNTEILPDRDLADKGIQKSDFVLGFRPEWMRGEAGFARA